MFGLFSRKPNGRATEEKSRDVKEKSEILEKVRADREAMQRQFQRLLEQKTEGHDNA